MDQPEYVPMKQQRLLGVDEGGKVISVNEGPWLSRLWKALSVILERARVYLVETTHSALPIRSIVLFCQLFKRSGPVAYRHYLNKVGRYGLYATLSTIISGRQPTNIPINLMIFALIDIAIELAFAAHRGLHGTVELSTDLSKGLCWDCDERLTKALTTASEFPITAVHAMCRQPEDRIVFEYENFKDEVTTVIELSTRTGNFQRLDTTAVFDCMKVAVEDSINNVKVVKQQHFALDAFLVGHHPSHPPPPSSPSSSSSPCSSSPSPGRLVVIARPLNYNETYSTGELHRVTAKDVRAGKLPLQLANVRRDPSFEDDFNAFVHKFKLLEVWEG
eukprot:GHVQ01021266.1.p1 GENE.GHVQ01021266.1~~GHVQ01021266.1.p1  ORF type:complete len:368 (-),score=55.14 GHVQ01021266.1:363-1361(-)